MSGLTTKIRGLGLVALVWMSSASALAETPEERLEALGLSLPKTSAPVANYVPAVRTGSLLFLAGHIPRDSEGRPITGKVGETISNEAAHGAAQTATLALLATLKQELGDLSRVRRVVKVVGFVNTTSDYTQQSAVMNGCSDLLVQVFGDKGKHARSAVSANSLPLGVPVEIELIVEVD